MTARELQLNGMLYPLDKELWNAHINSKRITRLLNATLETEVARRKELAHRTSAMLDNAFAFLETAFSQGQELVMFVTEITAGADTSWFVENFGCDAYFRHNKELLFDQTQQRIRDSILEAKSE